MSVEAGLHDFSNYLLYNFHDTPDELYERLKINVDLSEELNVSIYSFPMKYHPIKKEEQWDQDYSHNRDYIGEHWNRKYIRAIQAVLNSTKGNKFVQEQFKLEDNYALSFTDMYVSLKKGKTQEVLEGLYDSSKLQLITNKILNRKDKITEITCTGSASKPGNDNKTLANNRARVVKAWLSGLKLCDVDKIKSDFTEETGGDDDVNSVSSKLYRHVRVDIKITAEESDTVQNIERE